MRQTLSKQPYAQPLNNFYFDFDFGQEIRCVEIAFLQGVQGFLKK
jgi:hypothetical protein